MRKSADQALPSLSRRTFVAAAATTGAAAALGLSGCSPKADTEAGAGADEHAARALEQLGGARRVPAASRAGHGRSPRPRRRTR